MQWPTADQTRRYQEWQDQHGDLLGRPAVSREQDAAHLLNHLLAARPTPVPAAERGPDGPPPAPVPAPPAAKPWWKFW